MEGWIEGKCVLSQEPCLVGRDGDNVRFRSNFGGGSFVVTASVQCEMEAKPTARPRLMRWVYEQNVAGNEWPKIDSQNWKSISARVPLRASRRVREFVMFLRRMPIGQEFRPGTVMGYQFDSSEEVSRVFAACDIELDFRVIMDIRRNALEAGYIDDRNRITFRGHQYLEEFEQETDNSYQAFVAMWFDPKLSTSLFESIIEPAILRAGYKSFRIDRKEHANRIDDEIVGEIRRSRFLIADFTCPVHELMGKSVAEHRGGVYYEAGLAHGLGLPVIWTCNAELISHIHFDTRQYNHLLWESNKIDEFGEALERRIRAVVGQGPIA